MKENTQKYNKVNVNKSITKRKKNEHNQRKTTYLSFIQDNIPNHIELLLINFIDTVVFRSHYPLFHKHSKSLCLTLEATKPATILNENVRNKKQTVPLQIDRERTIKKKRKKNRIDKKKYQSSK